MKTIGLLAFAFLLFGCAQHPTSAQMAAADYGRDMSQEECQETAEKFIKYKLKDPMSAVFQHKNCIKSYAKAVPLMGMSVEYGWLHSGLVNGKNAFGGYVGFREYKVLMRNGQIIRYCIADRNGLCIPSNQ